MAKAEPNKRQLKFETLNEMLLEAARLHEYGYQRSGNWSLGQACGHISQWMQFPIDGFPTQPLPLRAIFWVLKRTIGPGLKRKILANGFSAGTPTAPQTVPPGTLSDQEGLEQLRAAVTRLEAYDGPLYPSPLFGPMDHGTLRQVTLLHAEHHLGFLSPM